MVTSNTSMGKHSCRPGRSGKVPSSHTWVQQQTQHPQLQGSTMNMAIKRQSSNGTGQVLALHTTFAQHVFLTQAHPCLPAIVRRIRSAHIPILQFPAVPATYQRKIATPLLNFARGVYYIHATTSAAVQTGYCFFHAMHMIHLQPHPRPLARLRRMRSNAELLVQVGIPRSPALIIIATSISSDTRSWVVTRTRRYEYVSLTKTFTSMPG